MNTKHLFVITGPTAVGKTVACLSLAQALGTDIVAADARQCYQGMAIGTAQPTAEEQQAVRHHLVGFLPVEAPYSAAAFADDALACLEQLWQRHDHVVVTGGSGLYLQALCQGLAPIPSIPEELQAHLQAHYVAEGLAPFLATLEECDPIYYAQVDRANPRHVLRAVGVCLATGKPYTYWRTLPLTKRPFQVHQVALMRPREELYARIEARVETMLEEGLLEEFATLYPHAKALLARTIGYRELITYVEGKCSLPEAVVAIKQDTRHYAKRQLTWLRKVRGLHWLPATEAGALEIHFASYL